MTPEKLDQLLEALEENLFHPPALVGEYARVLLKHTNEVMEILDVDFRNYADKVSPEERPKAEAEAMQARKIVKELAKTPAFSELMDSLDAWDDLNAEASPAQ